jgi:hypothetical protein
MRTIKLEGRSSLEAVVSAMRDKETFIIVSEDKDFNPLGYDLHSALVWIGAAGGGMLMILGAGAIVLAFLDPEPTSKLGLLVGGGVLMAVTGGGVILTILITRSSYAATMRYDQREGKYEWILRPTG